MLSEIDDDMSYYNEYCMCDEKDKSYPGHKLLSSCANVTKQKQHERFTETSADRERRLAKKQNEKDNKKEVTRRNELKKSQADREHSAQNEGEFSPWTTEQQEAYSILKANCIESRAAKVLATRELHETVEKLRERTKELLDSKKAYKAGKVKGSTEYTKRTKAIERAANVKRQDISKQIDQCSKEKEMLPTAILRRKYESATREQLEEDKIAERKINKVIDKHLLARKQVEKDEKKDIAALLCLMVDQDKDSLFIAECGLNGSINTQARLDEDKLTHDIAAKQAKLTLLQDAKTKKLRPSVQVALAQFKQSDQITQLVEFCSTN